jgi:aspartate aminotransferase
MKILVVLMGAVMLINQPVQGALCGERFVEASLQNKEESSTLVAAKIVRERRAQGLPVYNWGIGENPFDVPEHLVQAVKDAAHKAPYTSVQGIPGLAEEVAKVYSVGEYTVSAENVIIAPGLKQVLFDIQRAFGGEIIHIVPHWVSYPEQTELLGKKNLTIHTRKENAYKLQPEELRKACEHNPEVPKLIIFNHPTNPTGKAYTKEEIQELANVATSYPLIILADEVYLGNHFNGERYSIAEYAPNQTIRTSSLSKEFASGGYRVGWATFPNSLSALRKAVASIGSSSYSCAPVPQQYAALAAMQAFTEYEPTRRKMGYIFQQIGKRVYERFTACGLTTYEPDAAWYVFLDFSPFKEKLHARGIHTSKELVTRLITEEGIVFVAGEAFGMPKEELVVRASFVDFNGRQAMQSLEGVRLDQPAPQGFYGEWLSHIDKGIAVLDQWLHEERI